MKDWILNKIIEKKNKENKNEMKVFNELVNTEFGKEILAEVFEIGFVEGYESQKKR